MKDSQKSIRQKRVIDNFLNQGEKVKEDNTQPSPVPGNVPEKKQRIRRTFFSGCID